MREAMPESSNSTVGENSNNSDGNLMSNKQPPPPVAPRNINISLQPWQSSTPSSDYGNSRSTSIDSLESNSSSGGNNHHNPGTTGIECIPTRIVGKTPKLPSHNPLQFVKVESPLYKKAEQQIKQTKEVKIARHELKEGEEEWQSKLDNWKSHRRKVSEKVIQRAEEMRKIEAEEQLRKDQCQQQRKIKKFSEIVERRSSSISYNLDLYISQGHDSGLGGTPEPDDILDGHILTLRSDTSEGMTSEAESIDSDTHKSDKVLGKELPKIPQKPNLRLKLEKFISEFDADTVSDFTNQLKSKDSSGSDNFSSTEPSDIEGHACDSETISSEDDLSYLSDVQKPESITEINCQGSQVALQCHLERKYNGQNECFILNSNAVTDHKIEDNNTICTRNNTAQLSDSHAHSFNICTKPTRGGKDQGFLTCVDSISKCSPSDIGLKEADKHVTVNVSLPVTKSTSKKSSFAEKLAVFSSGVNDAGVSSSFKENKTIAMPHKTNENKSTSLVLERRSTFEKGINEAYISRHKSSCLSEEEIFLVDKNADKRLSVDLTLLQINPQENITSKKGPPPPVPVKPKIRPKTLPGCFQVEPKKHDLSNSGIQLNSNNFFGSIPNSMANVSNMNDHSLNNFKDLQETNLEDKSRNNPSSNDCALPNESDLSQNLFFLPNYQNTLEISCGVNNREGLRLFRNNPRDVFVDTKYSGTDLENKTLNNYNCDSSSKKADLEATYMQKEQTEEKVNKFLNDKESITSCSLLESFTSTETPCDDEEPSKNLNNEQISYIAQINVVSDTEIDIDSKVLSTNMNFSQNITPILPLEITEIKIKDSDLANGLLNVDSIKSEKVTIENIDEFDSLLDNNYLNADDNSDENVNNQTNTSSLSLSLEKIDEDDVISASTTTSSETPDTETVIETLPTNLSPLPNDEESSRVLHCTDKEIDSIEISPLACNLIPQAEIDAEASDMVYNEQASLSDITLINETNVTEIFPEVQKEEYCRELDESIDQITSLDVMDEIEKRLMQQLAGDLYEEMNEGLTVQLEDDINKPWLYFSEESELIEDLTPKNLQPPSEPPPPPPLPENDILESKIQPFARSNSTKRIKKELWRRRSDFLGLDSHDGIDIDNILPPPPGLEDILKQEREQNQWLEKRLSLPLTDTCLASSISECSTIERPAYGKYCSEYNLENKEDISRVPSEAENWKESLEEDNFYETPLNESTNVPNDVFLIPSPGESNKIIESPQNKIKQNLHTLGAAPKAKIMDSNKWITEKNRPTSKKPIEPAFHQKTYNQKYWLELDDEQKCNDQLTDKLVERRYSIPNQHPDVTVRTWDDRECEIQKHRPKSTICNWTTNDDLLFELYPQIQEDFYPNEVNDCMENECDSDVLESELHQCSCCQKGLCEGSAMGIEALSLYFHIECFHCCLCHIQLGNGTCGTDVQVKNNQLYCSNCFKID